MSGRAVESSVSWLYRQWVIALQKEQDWGKGEKASAEWIEWEGIMAIEV